MRSFAIGIVAAAVVIPTASALWSPRAVGSGASRARVLGAGNVPAASVSAKKVTVTWTVSTFTSGGSVPAYVARRYNATTGALQAIGANCAGTITALTCTENNAPSGNWQYTITPAAGNWRGTESGKSGAVTVT